ncbi:MAG: hypothetical protein JSR48_11480 [Verrucomicrobia bacterium]|nr:hypothetical protein [Verrucomicrobiota bacterium]
MVRPPEGGSAAPVASAPPVPPPVPRPPGAPRRSAQEIRTAARKSRLIKLVLVGVGGVIVSGVIIGVAISKFAEPEIRPPPRRPPAPAHAPKVVQAQPAATPAPSEPKVAAEPPAGAPSAEEPVAKDEAAKPAVQPKPKSGSVAPARVTTDLEPGVKVTTDAVEAEVEASKEFTAFVASTKISGVFQGSPSRAFINGRLVRAGEFVDQSLGIRFESVDPQAKTILFIDGTGAKVTKRY